MGKFIDLTGKTFERLTVIKKLNEKRGHEFVWLCKCNKDGNTIKVTGGALRKGQVKSCGCFHKEKTHDANFIDLSGKKYNKLKVLGFYEIKNKRTYWKCLCNCGKTCIVRGDCL